MIRSLMAIAAATLMCSGCGGESTGSGGGNGDAPSSATPLVGADGHVAAGIQGGGECARDPDGSILAAGAGRIPLKEGLTLARTYRDHGAPYDSECLYQVTRVDDRQIWTTRSCHAPTAAWVKPDERRICRSDLIDARTYSTYIVYDKTPAVIRGTTFFSLSRASFTDLKRVGVTPYRVVAVSTNRLITDLGGSLKRDRTGTRTMLVNDGPVTLPVVEGFGTIGPESDTYLAATVLDDERFPLVLEFTLGDESGFTSIRYTTVSYPNAGLEQHLAGEKRVDVYGIYFDMDDRVPRPESEPVLRQIAEALNAHRDWHLTIIGHTDNDGDDAASLTLSQQRSEAVRTALVDRYGIASSRLTSKGLGGSQPKASNDTLEGRARNRRIELIRQ